MAGEGRRAALGVLLLVTALAGCGPGGRGPLGSSEQPGGDSDGSLRHRDRTAFLRAERGHLVARSVGPSALDGWWVAEAGLCEEPRSFQLLGRGDSVDLMIVLELPGDSAAPGRYVVVPVGDTAIPVGKRVARLGVQRMRYVDLAYRAVSGVVELERLDRVATGRFDVVLREITSEEEVHYRGVFDRVPVRSLPLAACRPAGEPEGGSPRGG